MLYIFLDESGSFECNDGDKNKNEIIGGVICKGIRNEESIKELRRYIENEFIYAGGLDYSSKIHGSTRNGRIQNNILKNISSDANLKGRIIPFYIKKGTINKKINSNISDDENGALLYLNMLNRVVSNIIFYSSRCLDNDNEVVINLPTRSFSYRKLSQEKLKSFKEFSLVDKDGKISINSSYNLISALNSEISNCDFIKNKIHIKINTNQITYDSENIENDNNIFYQLSDFICNNAYLEVMDNLNDIVFAYDDIDEAYRKVFKFYNEKRLYEYINEKEMYDIQFKNSQYKMFYDNYINKLDEKVLYSSTAIKDFIEKENEEIKSKNYNRLFVKQKLEHIEKYIASMDTRRDLKTAVEYYVFKMKTYNHLGKFKDNDAIFKNIMGLTAGVNSLDIIDLRMEAANLYAVSLSNEFLFKDCVKYIDGLIAYQGLIEEIYNDIACDMDGRKNIKVCSDINMGKYLSSKGQYLSFINDKSAEECFLKAVECFDNTAEKSQTITYLIHYYSYFKIIPKDEIQSIINKYFGFSTPKDGIDYFSSAAFEDLLKPCLSFKLFAFIKYLRVYSIMGQTVEVSSIKKLSDRLMNLCSYVNDSPIGFEHPYELIFFDMAGLADDGHIKNEFIKKAAGICNNPNSGFTLKMIGFMIKLSFYKNKKDLKDFLEFLDSEDVSDETKKYFDVNTLCNENDMNKVLDIINSKFTYMYR